MHFICVNECLERHFTRLCTSYYHHHDSDEYRSHTLLPSSLHLRCHHAYAYRYPNSRYFHGFLRVYIYFHSRCRCFPGGLCNHAYLYSSLRFVADDLRVHAYHVPSRHRIRGGLCVHAPFLCSKHGLCGHTFQTHHVYGDDNGVCNCLHSELQRSIPMM